MGLKKLIFNRYLHVLYLFCYGGVRGFFFSVFCAFIK